MKTLIIEDNQKLAASLKKGLEGEGFVVDLLHDGEAGFRRLEAARETYDVVVLDRMLPGIDGVEVCRRLRKARIPTPVLMLTAKDTLEDKVEGLQSGADDYLVKPFALSELTARLHALLRRPQATYAEELVVGDLVLSLATHKLMKRKKEIPLTEKEYAILLYLMRNPERIVTRQEILDHAWDYDFTSFSNLVDVKIKNIRKKIGDKSALIIETVRGAGYRLNQS
ncbi:MAG: two component transcriptional regulator [Parcubacteria group bacterium]|nr:two component transcriptional regulator [Parcubacteria group bacterium]